MFDLDSVDIKFPEASARYALVAITLHGCRLAAKIEEKFPDVDFYCPEKFKDVTGIVVSENRIYKGGVKKLLPHLLGRYEGIIAIVSLGALIRLAAPHLKDKTSDPAILVLDEKGEFVVSALSGHLGGANELARNLAAKIGAQPVITTASDVQKTIAVDLIGRDLGWTHEPCDDLTELSAAMVNEESVCVIQESGSSDWLPQPLPPNISLYNKLSDAVPADAKYWIIITHRMLKDNEIPNDKKYILVRPKVIGLGIGCNRGTQATEIRNVVLETLEDLRLSAQCVHGIASIDIKQDEPGLLEFSKSTGWKIFFYPAEKLNEAKIDNPSDVVFKYTGAYGVSEPAARIYTENDNLLLTKKVSGNVTVSVGIMNAEIA